MAIRSDVDVGRANKLGHFLRAGEAVMKDYLRLHSHLLGQGLQGVAVLVPLPPKDMRMRRARDDVNDILVFRQNLRQRLDHVFDSLVRRKQAKREQDCLPFYPEPVFVEIRIEKWQVWDSVRNHVDLAARHVEDLPAISGMTVGS